MRRPLALLALLVALTAPWTGAAGASGGSAGCGLTTAPGDYQETLQVGSLQRSYLLHVPVAYTSTVPLPLVLNLPGTDMTSGLEAWVTHMSRSADEASVIVAYPQGVNLTWQVAATATVDNDFLNALVQQLEGSLCVDTSRVGLTGLSIGAVMDYHMLCADTPWLDSVAPVAGTMTTWPRYCGQNHPTPLLAINGMLDPVVPYEGHPPYWLSVPTDIGWMAQIVSCGAPSSTAQDDITTTVMAGCNDGAEVDLYTVSDGGHQWPGGITLPGLGYCSPYLDASTVILQFVQDHPGA